MKQRMEKLRLARQRLLKHRQLPRNLPPPRRLALWAVLLTVFGVTLGALTVTGVIWWFRDPALSVNRDALAAEIGQLRSERDSLQERVLMSESTRELLDRRPTADVLLALPTPFIQSLTRDVMRGWFHAVDVRLRNITVTKDGEVRAKLGILGNRTVGAYSLRLLLTDVHGRLASGTPQLRFVNDPRTGDRIDIDLPVTLEGGQGTGRAAFRWDSKGLANAICHDVSTEQTIDGLVSPARYEARGTLRLQATREGLLLKPQFPGLSMHLFIEPSKASIGKLQTLLASQGGLCRVALSKAKVEERILELVGRGFDVKIPTRFFRPVTVPIAIDGAVPIAATKLLLSATPDTLVITPQAVWLGARVAVHGATR